MFVNKRVSLDLKKQLQIVLKALNSSINLNYFSYKKQYNLFFLIILHKT